MELWHPLLIASIEAVDASLDGISLGSLDGVSLRLLDGLLDGISLGLLDEVSLGQRKVAGWWLDIRDLGSMVIGFLVLTLLEQLEKLSKSKKIFLF